MKKRELFSYIRTLGVILGFVFLVLAGVSVFRVFAQLQSENSFEISTPAEVSHRVLFLSSFNPQYFSADAQLEGLKASLYPNGVEFDTLYMDAGNYNMLSDKMAFYDYFKSRMQSRRKYEAVITGDDAALKFAMENREEFFEGLPLVYFGVNDRETAEAADKTPMMAGFYENNYLAETIETAVKLFPERKRIIGIHDESEGGKADAESFLELRDEYAGYDFLTIDTAYATLTEFVHNLERLPEDGIVIFMTCYSDIDGNTYSLLDRTHTIVSNTQLPVFRNYMGAEDTGIIGGSYLDIQEQSRMAGELIVAALNGADIDSVDTSADLPGKSSYDYLMLRKFDLDTAQLPGDATVYNKPETFLERYGYILPPIGYLAATMLMLLIAAMASSMGVRLSNKELRESKTQIERSEQEMRYRAEHDELMGLYNRRAASEHLREMLKPDEKFSVLMADIDGFKNVNESYGHQITDEILITIASALKELSYENGWFLARYGGDEFIFMIKDKHIDVHDWETRELLDIFKRPIPISGETVALAASIGISNSDGETGTDQHILNAESAMYVAKSRGGNGAFLFDDRMKQKQKDEERIREKLLEAFENDGFYMLYQPKIDAVTKKVNGYEALVRMKEPGIYPGQFIPVAEQNGWIWKIGRITTELVIKQLAAWRDEGYELHPVSVNFSSNQINDLGYLKMVEDLLEKYDIPAKYLEIEITEGLFLDRTSQSENLFKSFKDMGIRLLMDDFGTGYSSLGYLTYIPVDVIKLDKSLVDAYLVDGRDLFIRDVIQLMHDLDKEMIIEGVEEEWQYQRLREFGAETIQGYFFSKPIPADEAISFEVK